MMAMGSKLHSSRVMAGLALAVAAAAGLGGWGGAAQSAEPVSRAADPARPLWIRTPAVSPDGSRIAFTYGGQIWLVPAAGGEAVPLTSAPHYSHNPVWSPDGSRIAFASRRHGNDDVFVMPVEGGAATRLTQHSAGDVPQTFSADGKKVYFNSTRLGAAGTDALDGVRGLMPFNPQLYEVPVEGGRERLLVPTPTLDVSLSADGARMLYTNLPSIENEWRKHQVSDAARDVWQLDLKSGSHRRLTDFRGEDRNAVFGPQQDTMFWLSERSGNFNVWRQALGGGAAQQVTFHKDHPVRFLTSARDGTLVYAYDGEIWRLPVGSAQPQRVAVRVRQGDPVGGTFKVRLNEQATELALSPTAPELALVARGDVFVVSLLTGATRRITHTGAEERGVSYAPDGRKLLYATERNGNWDLIEARLKRAQDKGFSGVAPFDEALLVGGPADDFQPLYSPRGDRVAYRGDRSSLRVFDIAAKTSIEVLPKDAVYSYEDDDWRFAWSPDGRWLVTRTGFENTSEIELIDASGREARRNLSLNGFQDRRPQVSADASAVLWLSDRESLRTISGDAVQTDVMAAFLSADSLADFRETPPERAAASTGTSKTASTATSSTAAWPDVKGLARRTLRLSPYSSDVKFFRLTPDKRMLVVVTADEQGAWTGLAIDLPSGQPRTLFKRPPMPNAVFATDAAVQTLYTLGPAGIDRIDLAGAAAGQVRTLPFDATVERDAQAEVAAIFEHAWRLTQAKFYDAKLHGVDWPAVGAAYRKFLPHIRHWEDLAEMLSEMAGELNASHQGSHLSGMKEGDATGALGLYYDESHQVAGLRVAEVLAGGPADRPGSALKVGALVLAIDGQTITPDRHLHGLLNNSAGRPVLVSVQPAGGGAPVDEVLKPVHWVAESSLAYERWVEKRRALVARLSGGRIGYLHLSAMNLASYQRAYADLFGMHRQAEAVIVDVRYNGGGNLHDPLVVMLTGRQYAGLVTRDGVPTADIPAGRWAKPSLVLGNASSYSDGSAFPALYQREKIGPVVGDRIPGTGTAVVWELQIERHLDYGVPQLGFLGKDGRWFENQEIVPDVLIAADPNAVAAGRDVQIEAAVTRLLQDLNARKP
jgi:tricorn protease